jgi:hypothetical protein
VPLARMNVFMARVKSMQADCRAEIKITEAVKVKKVRPRRALDGIEADMSVRRCMSQSRDTLQRIQRKCFTLVSSTAKVIDPI